MHRFCCYHKLCTIKWQQYLNLCEHQMAREKHTLVCTFMASPLSHLCQANFFTLTSKLWFIEANRKHDRSNKFALEFDWNTCTTFTHDFHLLLPFSSHFREHTHTPISSCLNWWDIDFCFSFWNVTTSTKVKFVLSIS